MANEFSCPNCNLELPVDSTGKFPQCTEQIPEWMRQTINRSQINSFTSQELNNTVEYQSPASPGDHASLNFGNYELLNEVGRGGMSVVNLARQKKRTERFRA